MQKLITIFVALFFSLSANAQQTIEPPNLICVTTLFDGNVVLEWELPPAQTCGAFLGYRIYATSNASAPYSLLATVTDQTETNYTHVNANGGVTTWYYYMTTDLQCPTFQVGQSVILDNLSPETPPITSVSINNNGNIELDWETSTSPETEGYVIYQETTSGFIAIDTVLNGATTFEHIGVDISVAQTYTIAAIDACGNIGLLYDNPHRTILLEVDINRCNQTLDLTWEMYQNWDNPITAHQIRATVNGSPRSLVQTVSGEDFIVSLSDYNDGDFVCLTAQAVELFTGSASTTNEICVTVDIVEPQDYIYLSNVSINDNGDLEIFWNWDAAADLQEYSILQNDVPKVQTLQILQPLAYHLDTTFVADTGSVAVQISSTDSCDAIQISTLAKTIFLEGSPNSNYQNLLRWSAFEMEFSEVFSYQIYRTVEDIPELVGNVDGNTLSFTDEIDGYNEAEADIQYYVVAQHYIELPDGTMKAVFSQSNTILIQQQSKIFMPNAFVPEGQNNEFKPVMVFAENSTFQMLIYDRWGQLLFETTDAGEGWNGRQNGNVLRQGVYTYVVRVTQLNGETIEQKGTVVLIR
jgi:gliding motility-associated-like protein